MKQEDKNKLWLGLGTALAAAAGAGLAAAFTKGKKTTNTAGSRPKLKGGCGGCGR